MIIFETIIRVIIIIIIISVIIDIIKAPEDKKLSVNYVIKTPNMV